MPGGKSTARLEPSGQISAVSAILPSQPHGFSRALPEHSVFSLTTIKAAHGSPQYSIFFFQPTPKHSVFQSATHGHQDTRSYVHGCQSTRPSARVAHRCRTIRSFGPWLPMHTVRYMHGDSSQARPHDKSTAVRAVGPDVEPFSATWSDDRSIHRNSSQKKPCLPPTAI